MAKFPANNHVNKSTRVTLFFADNGFHPRTGVELPQQASIGVSRKAELLSADKIVANQGKMALFLQDQLT